MRWSRRRVGGLTVRRRARPCGRRRRRGYCGVTQTAWSWRLTATVRAGQSSGDTERVLCEDGAHRDVLKEDFEVAGEAVKIEPQRPSVAEQSQAVDEVLTGLLILLHEVAHALGAEEFEPLGEVDERLRAVMPLGIACAAQQCVEVFVEA